MSGPFDKLVQTVEAVFGSPTLDEAGIRQLRAVQAELAKPASEDLGARVGNHFLEQPGPPDNRCGLAMFLFDVTLNPEFITRAIRALPSAVTPATFNDLFWNISRREFLNPGISRPYEVEFRERFHAIANDMKAAVRRSLPGRPRKPARRALRVAILSSGVLGMRHSPTREAISFCLHLSQNHQCKVHLFNTNSMVYANTLNLFLAFIANQNPGFSGRQRILVDYLDFKGVPVDLVSLEPGRMGTAKAIAVRRALSELDIDVIICHGENLFIQEATVGDYPSLFATTGGIVPFARSDAYWVPASLVKEEHRAMAARFGHGELMLESMFSTPESPSQKPAIRSALGLRPSDLLMLCVSTRLDGEMERGFTEAISRFLEGRPEARVLFAGSPQVDVTARFPPHLADRVKNIGFQEDLSAICQMCDVYVNLYRHGGGTSAQTAILSGLPVVTRDFGHISDIVPADRRQPSWDAYVGYLTQLAVGADARKAEAAYFRQSLLERQATDKQVERVYRKLCALAGVP